MLSLKRGLATVYPPSLVSYLGCLNHSVGGSRRNLETLSEQLEVVDERLHGILHRDKEQQLHVQHVLLTRYTLC